MPYYDYMCSSCNERQEVFKRMADPDVVDCPGCGEKNCLKRIFDKQTLPAVYVKGGTPKFFQPHGADKPIQLSEDKGEAREQIDKAMRSTHGDDVEYEVLNP